MTVSQVCQRQVDLVDLDESAWTAADRMHQRAVGSLIVLNRAASADWRVDRSRFGGEGDCCRKSPSYHPCARHHDCAGQDRPGVCLAERGFSLMRDGELRRLPVVDAVGRLVGILALDDVFAHLAHEFHDIGRILDQQAPREVVAPPSE